MKHDLRCFSYPCDLDCQRHAGTIEQQSNRQRLIVLDIIVSDGRSKARGWEIRWHDNHITCRRGFHAIGKITTENSSNTKAMLLLWINVIKLVRKCMQCHHHLLHR